MLDYGGIGDIHFGSFSDNNYAGVVGTFLEYLMGKNLFYITIVVWALNGVFLVHDGRNIVVGEDRVIAGILIQILKVARVLDREYTTDETDGQEKW